MIKFNKYKKFGGQGYPPYNTKILLITLSIIVVVGLPIIGYLNFIGYSFRHHKILTKDELLQNYTQDYFGFNAYIYEDETTCKECKVKFYEIEERVNLSDISSTLYKIFDSADLNRTFEPLVELSKIYTLSDITDDIIFPNRIEKKFRDRFMVNDYVTLVSYSNKSVTPFKGYRKIIYPKDKTIIFYGELISFYDKNAITIKECDTKISNIDRIFGASRYCVTLNKISILPFYDNKYINYFNDTKSEIQYFVTNNLKFKDIKNDINIYNFVSIDKVLDNQGLPFQGFKLKDLINKTKILIII